MGEAHLHGAWVGRAALWCAQPFASWQYLAVRWSLSCSLSLPNDTSFPYTLAGGHLGDIVSENGNQEGTTRTVHIPLSHLDVLEVTPTTVQVPGSALERESCPPAARGQVGTLCSEQMRESGGQVQ